MMISLFKISLFLCTLAILPVSGQDSSDYAGIKSGIFQIDKGRSILNVYVGRAGFFSKMGHNHVITSRDITGQINYHPAPLPSTAEFTIPVPALEVDNAEQRRNAGAGYESVPSEQDIQGTRANMLDTTVLDGTNYPRITVQIGGVTQNDNLNSYEINLVFKGEHILLNLEGYTHLDENNLRIDTDFVLDHKQLNLKPFSALGGMLRVAEQIRFNLIIEAVRE